MAKLTNEERRKRKQEKEARINAWYARVHKNFILNKAEELNKILRSKKVASVEHIEGSYTVKFKNGQVFRFTFKPESHFLDRKIIPIFE
jgi:hypothetical protein